MTVKELIIELQKYPEDMEVWDLGMPIESVRQGVWIHNNYPYDKPDKEIVIIE